MQFYLESALNIKYDGCVFYTLQLYLFMISCVPPEIRFQCLYLSFLWCSHRGKLQYRRSRWLHSLIEPYPFFCSKYLSILSMVSGFQCNILYGCRLKHKRLCFSRHFACMRIYCGSRRESHERLVIHTEVI